MRLTSIYSANWDLTVEHMPNDGSFMLIVKRDVSNKNDLHLRNPARSDLLEYAAEMQIRVGDTSKFDANRFIEAVASLISKYRQQLALHRQLVAKLAEEHSGKAW